MNKSIVLMITLLLAFISLNCSKEEQSEVEKETTTAAESQMAMSSDGGYSLEAGGIKLHWAVDGDALNLKLSAPTTGWVGIGFNPTEEMKDANFVIGYVKDGELKVIDHHGNAKRNHKSDEALGGSDNVANPAGSEDQGVTEISFTLPLNTGDSLDSVVDPAVDNTVLLAYGKTDRLVQQHILRAKLKINFSTGSYQVLSVKQ